MDKNSIILPEYLNRYVNNENTGRYINYDPLGVSKLLRALGNPQDTFSSVHVAGTNGKGSTCFFIEKIFRDAGYKTGLFVSPHLNSICERIRLNGELISEKDFAFYADAADRKAKELTEITPTFFDMTTAAAFLYFKAEKTDVAVVETGLGGRKDSTNVLNPLCSVITSISLDHMAVLGNTLEKIAGEKAGIIKQNTPAVTYNTDPKTVSVLKKEASEKNAPFLCADETFFMENIIPQENSFLFDYRYNDGRKETVIKQIKINSPVIEQIKNASAAITAVLTCIEKYPLVTPESIKASVSGFTPEGRFRIMCQDPLIIYDPAHNPEAVKAFIKAVENFYPSMKKTAAVTFMKDKDYASMLPFIADHCDEMIFFQLEDSRALKPDAENFPGLKTAASPEELYRLLKEGNSSPDRMIFFTGSFRLYPAAEKTAEFFRKKE